jgi:hypothetical protein
MRLDPDDDEFTNSTYEDPIEYYYDQSSYDGKIANQDDWLDTMIFIRGLP